MQSKDLKDKDAEEDRPRSKKPPGLRKFEKLLRHVVNAPPMRKNQRASL